MSMITQPTALWILGSLALAQVSGCVYTERLHGTLPERRSDTRPPPAPSASLPAIGVVDVVDQLDGMSNSAILVEALRRTGSFESVSEVPTIYNTRWSVSGRTGRECQTRFRDSHYSNWFHYTLLAALGGSAGGSSSASSGTVVLAVSGGLVGASLLGWGIGSLVSLASAGSPGVTCHVESELTVFHDGRSTGEYRFNETVTWTDLGSDLDSARLLEGAALQLSASLGARLNGPRIDRSGSN